MSLLACTLISSNAYSGSTGTSGGDGKVSVCISCDEIPIPNLFCPIVSSENKLCGTENWIVNGSQDCRRIIKTTVWCETGGTQVYTHTEWAGTDTWCNGDNLDCQH
ncbi:MAG: hypothetical protein GC165_08900 [Armatimonadetes bacterium]|nr:hypothetical protein [Armatimonadota bacterium]MBS1728754.1 hypothetical protein [Armatimonadota bacterium]